MICGRMNVVPNRATPKMKADARARGQRHVSQRRNVDHAARGRATPRAGAQRAPRRRRPLTIQSLANQFSCWPRSRTICMVVSPDGRAGRSRPVDAARPRARYGGIDDERDAISIAGDAHRHVDVEDPRPAVGVGKPAAQRPARRPAPPPRPCRDGHRHALLPRREALAQDRQRERDERAAAEALDDAVDEHRREAFAPCRPGPSRG